MKKYILLLAATIIFAGSLSSQPKSESDRKYWTNLCYRIAEPVLNNMSRGELTKNMKVEVSPNWDNRNIKVTYMEAFGRLMAGITPWLALPDDNTEEGMQRKQLREWALKSYRNAVDPQSPDCLLWSGSNQILVDASYLALSFLRAPNTFWKPLDDTTKKRYIEAFKGVRTIRPAYNNWLLFRLTVETFLAFAGESVDGYAVYTSIRKMDEWYLGDGWYGDGARFSMDYYNSFVIHPMLVESLEILESKKTTLDNRITEGCSFKTALSRMQRFNCIVERMISPEGTFPPVGRSTTYRLAAFHTLALSAWKYNLPEELTNGQVRSAITLVMKRMFSVDGNFNKEGFLQLGFVGHQPNLANSYTNNGSLYITSTVFLPLGLPADHAFWTSPAEKWTSQKAWSGEKFPIDGPKH